MVNRTALSKECTHEDPLLSALITIRQKLTEMYCQNFRFLQKNKDIYNTIDDPTSKDILDCKLSTAALVVVLKLLELLLLELSALRHHRPSQQKIRKDTKTT